MTTVVIGAGIGGLSAAIALAAAGEPVTVLERQDAVGGKLRPVMINGEAYDGCATVMTMRWVFEELFALAGADFTSACPMTKLETYARHYWSGGACLDLHAERAVSIEAIKRFAGKGEAEAYSLFMENARAIHDSLKQPFLKNQRPSLIRMMAQMPLKQLVRVNPYESLWTALRKQFTDRRLVQLFARYATYCGSSPFDAPATLMLIAHVEAEGVWRIDGGMAQLPKAMQTLAEKSGVKFIFNAHVEKIERESAHFSVRFDQGGQAFTCNKIVINADPTAVASGLFGQGLSSAADRVEERNRSFSGISWCGKIGMGGPALSHHTVFFSDDYETEFKQLSQRLPDDPTVYVCDQGHGRKQVLINAPAKGVMTAIESRHSIARRLAACGAEIDVHATVGVTHHPQDFAQLYPATYGALYGRALNTWNATFLRPQARTRIPGLYLAGGATHPGPGVPMAALSGMRAAEALLQDRASTKPFRKMAIAGGM
jgi:1-hydroxycarotenoid 3,4-desaturase